MANNSGLSKWKWLVGPIITLAIVAAGFIASWSTTRAAVAEVQKDQVKLEETIDGLEEKVHDVELKTAVDSSILEQLRKDVGEIKSDVKKILEGR